MENIDLNVLFGIDTVEKIRQRLNADTAFLAEAQADLNAAVKAHYGLDLPVPMVVFEGAEGWTAGIVPGDALADGELDLVAGGIPPRPRIKDIVKTPRGPVYTYY